ncbi:hypothetical protein [Flavilitoribacter nigricans]|nr:hypothetical protein [Flavilitoribacter nigricans]
MGKDLSIAIRALRTDYTKDMLLRNGEEKLFESPELIAEGDFDPALDEIRRKITITVIEKDPVTNDKGDNELFHGVPAQPGGRFILEQEVRVREEGDQEQSGKVGIFHFTLLMVVPAVAAREDGMKLPVLRPPVNYRWGSGARFPMGNPLWSWIFALVNNKK